MLSRAAFASYWTSAKSAKCIPCSSCCFIQGNKIKVTRNKVRWLTRVRYNHHFDFGQKLLNAQSCVDRLLSLWKKQYPLFYFSGSFWCMPHINSWAHCSKTAYLQFILREQIFLALFCTIPLKSQKQINIVFTLEWTCHAFFGLANLMSSIGSTAALIQGHRYNTNCHRLLQFFPETHIILDFFLQITANILTSSFWLLCETKDEFCSRFSSSNLPLKYIDMKSITHLSF